VLGSGQRCSQSTRPGQGITPRRRPSGAAQLRAPAAAPTAPVPPALSYHDGTIDLATFISSLQAPFIALAVRGFGGADSWQWYLWSRIFKDVFLVVGAAAVAYYALVKMAEQAAKVGQAFSPGVGPGARMHACACVCACAGLGACAADDRSLRVACATLAIVPTYDGGKEGGAGPSLKLHCY
jgi:hypothetical protein